MTPTRKLCIFISEGGDCSDGCHQDKRNCRSKRGYCVCAGEYQTVQEEPCCAVERRAVAVGNAPQGKRLCDIWKDKRSDATKAFGEEGKSRKDETEGSNETIGISIC